jgi:hypothetical protein
MDLYLYSPAIEQQGVIDSYSSLRWRRKFFEPGEFELHVPATDENLSLLAENNIIHRLDRKEAGLIEGAAISSTDDGDEITATGRFLSSKFDDRIIMPTINFSGEVEVAMRKIVSDNAITVRSINLLSLGTLNGFTPTVSFQATYKNVLAVLEALAKSSNIGFRMRLDVPNKALIFETYIGTDKSVTQTANPYVLFSDEFRNITDPAYTLNSQSYKNYAIVGGEGEGDARIIVEVDQTNGAPRRELWVDAKDLQQGDLTLTDYKAELNQRGLEKLAEAAKTESFEAAAVDTENFEYLTDWDLGDIVSFEKWGILLNQRVTEVEEVYEKGIETITPTCGTPLPETLDLGSDT